MSSLALGVTWLLTHRAFWLPESTATNNFSQKEALKFSVYRVLFDYGIRVDWIGGESRHKIVRIPGDLNPIEPYVDLINTFHELHGDILRAESNPKGDRFFLKVGLDNQPLFELTLVYDPDLKRVGGKIALVIDDFGYFFDDVVKGFLNLPQRVTFSIIPGLARSKQIAEAAFQRHRQVMIHMPMEPMNGRGRAGDLMLLTSMDAGQIRTNLRKAIRLVPHAVGLNNHMGSQATVDPKLLTALMRELREANLFFLDSRTNPRSLAFEWARKMRVPCAKNDTFLDSIDEVPFISQQLYSLAELATRQGHAIGIAHPGSNTLRVLRKELPNLEKKGFKFVSVSEIVQKRRVKK